jgi:hypothetical protein
VMLVDGVFVSAQMHADHEATALQARAAAEVLLDAALLAQSVLASDHGAH